MLFRILRPLPIMRNQLLNKILTVNYINNRLSTGRSRGSKWRTMQELIVDLAKTMGFDKPYQIVPESRQNLIQYVPKTQADLPPRTMKDTFLEALIPLSTEAELQNRYVTFLGYVRIGRLLEDMDIFAVMVAQKHILNPNLPEGIPSPQTLVTAFVDEIYFTDFFAKGNEDVKLSGHVSWVGTSTMEVIVWLEQQNNGVWHLITSALFVVAARDPTNKRAVPVNPLNPANSEEKVIFDEGEARKNKRMMAIKQHLTNSPPTNGEQKHIHNLYLKLMGTTNQSDITNSCIVNLPQGLVWMDNQRLSNIIFSHPEHRNLHNTVFGGFIMRQATELSWMLACRFSKHRPVLQNISDITFKSPIAVSSLIEMHAFIVYTQINLIQISVFVEAFDPATAKKYTSNTLHFLYKVPEVVPEVVPRTYHEAMMYIDGYRHFKEAKHTSIKHLERSIDEKDELKINTTSKL